MKYFNYVRSYIKPFFIEHSIYQYLDIFTMFRPLKLLIGVAVITRLGHTLEPTVSEKALTGICATHMFPGKCDLYNADGSITVYRNVKLMWFDRLPVIDFIPTAIFFKYPRLHELRLSNGIKAIDKDVFTNATELTSLELPENKLKIIPTEVFSHANRLRQIHLCSNEITEIEKEAFAKLPILQTLDLSSNLIKTIRTDTFSYIKSLKSLNLNDNEIDVIEENSFNLPNLKELYLSKNKLYYLFDDIFSVAPHLSYLELISTNLLNIRNALKNLPELKQLHLDNNNQIQDGYLKDFIQLSKLQGLSLRNTSVKLSDDLTNMTSNSHLIYLDLSHNNITVGNILYKLTAFSELQYLNLEHNAIADINDVAFINHYFKSSAIGMFGNDKLDKSCIVGVTKIETDSELERKILIRNSHNSTEEQQFIQYANYIISLEKNKT